jgi:phosphoglycolate phosphatase-like HAD superfamily hydrolase
MDAVALFDIDGTLLRRAGPHHRQALEEAVWRVAGVRASTQQIPVQGMLDCDILRQMLQSAGVPERQITVLLPHVIELAQQIYDCPRLEARLCPGLPHSLRQLQEAGVRLGLVSGNLPRIGWRKIEQAGLRAFFTFGAFAGMGATRAELVHIARQIALQSGASTQVPFALIGDHTNDILAARLNRVRSIAVATGVLSAQELAQAEPDILLDDLTQLSLDMLAPAAGRATAGPERLAGG